MMLWKSLGCFNSRKNNINKLCTYGKMHDIINIKKERNKAKTVKYPKVPLGTSLEEETEMASFTFMAHKQEIIETEKAYGIKYRDLCCCNINERNKIVWLPKSQTTLEEVIPYRDEELLFSEEEIESGESDWLNVTVPGWLAYKENYFKNTLLKVTSL